MIEQGTKAYWRAVIALSLASYFVFAMIYLTQPLLPLFTDQFQISPATASLSLSIVTFSISLSLLIYGPISDAIGRKSIMNWTMFGAVAMTVVCGFATNYYWLLTFRALQGFFLAGLPAIAMAYMSEEFSPGALSLGMGMYISANSLGGMSGRLSSGVIADLWGWKASFFVIGIISLGFVFSFHKLLPPSKRFQKIPFHFREATNAMIEHVKNRTLRVAFLIGGLHFFVFLGSFNYMTFRLSADPYNLSPTFLGLLFLTYFAGSIGSTVAGRLSQRWGKMSCLKVGIILLALGLICTLHPSLIVILIGLILICFSFFFSHSLSASWVNSHVMFARASASSLYLVSYYLGGSLGSVYLGWFWNVWRWPGVVLGDLLILTITFTGCWYLRNVEKREEQTEDFMLRRSG
ncbi:hypothetical protein BEP19_14120 [Ammoniphilus oxalaticus]|uniref:Major facilitator superfamily (MFS) profile domain-containing protein n=1 Tax=Ammoniphilus oxalaticus TaxID=66863 RepID=A0A419SEJ9_9BACL|nr:MFS transporter [Ammoniphilus oxalaticus]RKD21755.1 hypothetical protein BEP19_14120 [Ammoniphilus oxalaticus]